MNTKGCFSQESDSCAFRRRISCVILLLKVFVLDLNFILACKPELLGGISTEISKTSAIQSLVMVSAFAAMKALHVGRMD